MTTEERRQRLRTRLLEVALECRTLAGELQFLRLSDSEIEELELIVSGANYLIRTAQAVLEDAIFCVKGESK